MKKRIPRNVTSTAFSLFLMPVTIVRYVMESGSMAMYAIADQNAVHRIASHTVFFCLNTRFHAYTIATNETRGAMIWYAVRCMGPIVSREGGMHHPIGPDGPTLPQERPQ